MVHYHWLLSYTYTQSCTDGMEWRGDVYGRDGKPGVSRIQVKGLEIMEERRKKR